MAHLQYFVDIQYTQKGESSQDTWMGCTIYTKEYLLLVLCVDDPAKVRTKVKNPVWGPKWPILWLMRPYLHFLQGNLSIMRTL